MFIKFYEWDSSKKNCSPPRKKDFPRFLLSNLPKVRLKNSGSYEEKNHFKQYTVFK